MHHDVKPLTIVQQAWSEPYCLFCSTEWVTPTLSTWQRSTMTKTRCTLWWSCKSLITSAYDTLLYQSTFEIYNRSALVWLVTGATRNILIWFSRSWTKFLLEWSMSPQYIYAIYDLARITCFKSRDHSIHPLPPSHITHITHYHIHIHSLFSLHIHTPSWTHTHTHIAPPCHTHAWSQIHPPTHTTLPCTYITCSHTLTEWLEESCLTGSLQRGTTQSEMPVTWFDRCWTPSTTCTSWGLCTEIWRCSTTQEYHYVLVERFSLIPRLRRR